MVALITTGLILAAGQAVAQKPLDLATVVAALDRDGKVTLNSGNVIVHTFDFNVAGDAVEAVVVRLATGKHPGLLLIPGYSRTARDYIPLGLRLARDGFATVAITQRGFGRTAGPADFVGPKTIDVLEEGFRRFRREPYVDGSRMGLFGYSRGALAASLLAVRLTEDGLRAAVFAAGIYDFQKARAEIKLEGIRENMDREAGQSAAAARDRTSVHRMIHLPCPVLILHGDRDENAPIGQAYILRDELKRIRKDFTFCVFKDRDHDLGRQNLNEHTVAYFRRWLAKDEERK